MTKLTGAVEKGEDEEDASQGHRLGKGGYIIEAKVELMSILISKMCE
jgi:hypothetical protein